MTSLWSRRPAWLLGVALFAVWSSLAIYFRVTQHWSLFGFFMFAAGEAWGRSALTDVTTEQPAAGGGV